MIYAEQKVTSDEQVSISSYKRFFSLNFEKLKECGNDGDFLQALNDTRAVAVSLTVRMAWLDVRKEISGLEVRK